MAETFIILLLIVILIIVISMLSSQRNQINEIKFYMSEIEKKIIFISKHLYENNLKIEKEKAKPEVIKITEEAEKTEKITPEIITNAQPRPVMNRNDIQPELARANTPYPSNIPPFIKKSPLPEIKPSKSFFETHPNFEKFIGENLINKIGIAILVIGIGFLIKFSIDKQFINEIGRTLIGLFCGAILIGIAHRLRSVYSAFSSVLIGGASSILYFTIAISFHEYHLFNQVVAFLLMVVISAFTVILSIAYDKKELSVLSIIGGFATPFLVSTGKGEYAVLFTYIAILNTGMLALAYFKKWQIVNILSYIFTIVLFYAWFSKTFDKHSGFPFVGSLIFQGIFYVQFFLMNIINNIKYQQKFKAEEYLILLSNTFIYYMFSLIVFNSNLPEWKGVFTLAFAVYNLLFALSLYRNKKIDRNLAFFMIGLVLTLVSLLAPVQLNGNYITLFWASEALLLLWMWQRTELPIFKRSSILIQVVMLTSLIIDWSKFLLVYSIAEQNNFANKIFVTGIFAAITIILGFQLLKKEKLADFAFNLSTKLYKNLHAIIFAVMLYIVLFIHLWHWCSISFNYYQYNVSILGCFNYVYFLVLLIVSNKYQNKKIFTSILIVQLIGILLFITYFQANFIQARNLPIYNPPLSFVPFYLHYPLSLFALACVGVSFYLLMRNFTLSIKQNRILLSFLSIIALIVLSTELDHILVLATVSIPSELPIILEKSHRIGWPILWGISSFGLMLLGMKLKHKDLRLLSLFVFFVTLLKLFLFDIWRMSQGGITAAFISLGILLLIVSFLYQKVKKIITTEEN